MCALWLLVLCVFHHPPSGVDEKPSQIAGSCSAESARRNRGRALD